MGATGLGLTGLELTGLGLTDVGAAEVGAGSVVPAVEVEVTGGTETVVVVGDAEGEATDDTEVGGATGAVVGFLILA